MRLGSSNNTGVSKQNTHTHQTLRERKHWKELVSMEISDTQFFKTNPLFYQPLPFYRKNLNPPPFFKGFENSNPLLYKGGFQPCT